VIYLQWWLRAVGAKVGKNVCQLGVVGGIETDLKSLGDNVCMNFNAKPLSHSLEHHRLTFGTCVIESGATIGCRSIVEMDAIVPKRTSISSMTPVHAVKVSVLSARNLKIPASDISRVFTINIDAHAAQPSFKAIKEDVDLEAGYGSGTDEIVVTKKIYYQQ
jgi:hypothetical protein